MKILAVSDKVVDQVYSPSVRQKFPEAQLIIGCGDLPFYYLDFLVSATDKRLVYVRGNHDKGPQYTSDGRKLDSAECGTDIHGRCVKREGLLIAGLEGSMRYRPNRPYMYTESEMRYHVAKLMPTLLRNKVRYGRYLDILVTHSPPFGIHDKDDLPHTGFKIFLKFLDWFRPKYMLHGHIHIYRSNEQVVTKYLDTTIINVYPYAYFDLDVVPEGPLLPR